MTLYSIVYVSAHCGEDSVTLRVPNFITIGEIKNVVSPCSLHDKAILEAIDYHVEEIAFGDTRLSDLDDLKSVFFYKLGSLTPPADFEESDGESDVALFLLPNLQDDEPANTYMHPCRYSIPNANTYNNLQLISTQHSLHLYQPITLPSDYLTGQAAVLPPVPLPADWKDHITPLRTPGLFGYRAPALPAHHSHHSRHGSPRANPGSAGNGGNDTSESRGKAEGKAGSARPLRAGLHLLEEEEREALPSRPSERPSETQSSNRPPVVEMPRLASEGLARLRSLSRLAASQQAVPETQPGQGSGRNGAEKEMADGQSPLSSRSLVSMGHAGLQHAVSPSHLTLRCSRGEIGNSPGVESASLKKLAEMCPEYRSTMTIRSPHGLRFQSSFRISQRLPFMDVLSDSTQIGKEISFNMPALDDMPSDELLQPGFFKDRILLSIRILGKEAEEITDEKSCKVMADSYFNQKQLFGCLFGGGV